MAKQQVHFGYKLSAEQFAPRELLDFAVAAERLGFDSAAISDHFHPWRHDGGHATAALPWLGAAAQGTARIRLGTSVTTPTFRYHPAVVAQSMATLGVLYPGRMWLGVGTGEALNETPLGVAWPDAKERFARLREAVTLIRRLWSEDRVSVDGDFYRTRNATVYDRPDTPLPLYVAAAGPSAARLAGRLGDGLICTSGKDMRLYSETLIPSMRDAAIKAQRDPDGLDMMIEMKVSFDADPRRAMADAREWAALALSPEERTGVDDPMEMERLAASLPDERVAARWIVSSDADEHVRRIAPYLELGFTHLVFHAPGRDQLRFLELYARDVLPRLREVAGVNPPG